MDASATCSNVNDTPIYKAPIAVAGSDILTRYGRRSCRFVSVLQFVRAPFIIAMSAAELIQVRMVQRHTAVTKFPSLLPHVRT